MQRCAQCAREITGSAGACPDCAAQSNPVEFYASEASLPPPPPVEPGTSLTATSKTDALEAFLASMDHLPAPPPLPAAPAQPEPAASLSSDPFASLFPGPARQSPAEPMPAITHRYEAPADVFPSASRVAESPTLPGEPDRFDALSTTFTQPGRFESGDAPFTEPDPFAARGMTLDEPEQFDPLDPPAFSSSVQLDPLEPPAPAPAVAAAASPAKPSKAGPRVLLGAAAALVVGAFTLMAVANGLNSDPATPIATPAAAAKSRPAAPAARPATAPVTPTEPAAAPTLPPAPAPAAVRPTWTSENRQWVWNQKKGIAFELPSANKVATWQRHVVPVLVVRCVSKTVDAFVFIESAAKMEAQDEKHGVQLAFDDAPAIAERWQDSDEHDALFAPNGAAFAERLTRARRLRFGYTPHNAPHAVADFYVEGLAERMALVAAQCTAAKK